MRQRIGLYLFILTAGVALFLAYILENSGAAQITREYTRIIFLALYALFFASISGALWRARATIKNWVVANWRVGLFSAAVILAATVFSTTREPTNYKITADEYVLSLEAMSLHFEGVSAVPIRMHILGGVPRSLGGAINKRPPAFVTLLSFVHDVFGYSPSNVFYLNTFLVFVFFGLLYGYVYWLFGAAAAGFSCLLWSSFPLFYQNASGAGFEILNLVYILLFLFSAGFYLSRPFAYTQRLFLLAVILLANTRYESALFVLAAGAIILFQWFRNKKVVCDMSLFLAPLVMATFLLRMRVFNLDQKGNWQVADGQSPFSFEYIYDNVGHAMNYFMAFSRGSTTSEYLWLTGLVGAAFLIYGAIKGLLCRRADNLQLPLIVVALVIAANFFILLAYHWGQLDYPEVSRLGLPMALIASLGSCFLFFNMLKAPFVRASAWLVLVAFVIVVAIPRSALAISSSGNFHVRRADWILNQIKSMPPDMYVVAGNDVGRLFIERIPGLPIALLNHRIAEAAYHQRLKSHSLLVAQRFMVSSETGQETVIGDDWLHPAFRLETVAQSSFRPFVIVRLSRVVGVDMGLADKPMEDFVGSSESSTNERKPAGADVTPISADKVNEWVGKLP